MSLKDVRREIGQLAIAGFAGHSIPTDLQLLAKEFDLGGVILFARNVDDARAGRGAVARGAGRWRSELPLWVSVDQEGGRVARLKRAVHASGRRCGRSGGAATRRWPSGSRGRWRRSCKAVGISLDYTPVLDILTNPKNPVIGDRALAERAEDVAPARARDHPDAAGGGHRRVRQAFPGHGDTSVDSHHELPLIEHPPDRLERGRARAVQGGDRGRRRVRS